MLRKIKGLLKIHAKDVRTTELLKQEMAAVREKVNQLAASSTAGDSRRRNTVRNKIPIHQTSKPILPHNHSLQRTLSDPNATNRRYNGSNSNPDNPSVSNVVGKWRARQMETSGTEMASHKLNILHKQSDDKCNSSGTIRRIQSAHPSVASNEKPYTDTGGRKRSVRELLDGHECDECRGYFRVMQEQGMIVDEDDLRETLRRCSRHKSRYALASATTSHKQIILNIYVYLIGVLEYLILSIFDLCRRWEAPATPEGYWDLTIQTPEDWVKAKNKPAKDDTV